MGVLYMYVFPCVAILCLRFGESDQLPKISLETRFRSLETQLRNELLINSQRLSNLESLTKTKLAPGNIAAVDGCVNVDVENRLGDIERGITVLEDDVSKTIKRLARGLSKEKDKVRKMAEELSEIQRDDVEAVRERLDTFLDQYNDDKANTTGLNAQLIEAVGKLNDTFIEFRKDILSRKEVLVTEPPQPVCQPGWFQLENRCYLFINDNVNSKPWSLAALDCHKRGGKLAEPQTPEINDKLIDVVGDQRAWLGGTDIVTEGAWIWNGTNKSIPFFTWGPEQPSNTHNQDCLEIWQNQWNDLGCNGYNNYLCEKTMD